MKKRFQLGRSIVVVFAFFACSARAAIAQNDVPPDGQAETDAPPVWLFQSFFADAMADGAYWGGGLSVRDFDDGSAMQLDAVGSYAITSQIEVQGQLGFARIDPGEGSSASGFTDLLLAGHYVFDNIGTVSAIAAGGYVELPVGKRSVGGNTLDFGAYGAVRHIVNERATVTGNLGVDFVETTDFQLSLIGFCDPFFFGVCAAPLYELERKASLGIGGGVIYAIENGLNLIGELRLETVFDYAALSGGVDYAGELGHMRGFIAVGLDDGAPDLALNIQLLRAWR